MSASRSPYQRISSHANNGQNTNLGFRGQKEYCERKPANQCATHALIYICIDEWRFREPVKD
jgi:hypothetical protein